MDIGDKIKAVNWNFGGNVAEIFFKHARKSITFYYDSHNQILKRTWTY